MTQPKENTLETILVVDNHPVVRDVVREILQRAGFRVLATGSGAQAIQAERETQGTIDLLLSDVMMMDMSGPAIARRLSRNRPEMRVMLMSGYADGDMLFENHGWRFIEKPFLPAELVAKVNQVLHTAQRSTEDDYVYTRSSRTSIAAA